MSRTGIFVALALALCAADLNAQILRGRSRGRNSSPTYVTPATTPTYYGSPMMTTGYPTTTDGGIVMSPTMYGTPTMGTTVGTPTVTGGTIVSGPTMTTNPTIISPTTMNGTIVGTYPTTITPGYNGMMMPTTAGYNPGITTYPTMGTPNMFFNRVNTGRAGAPMAVSPRGGYYYIR